MEKNNVNDLIVKPKTEHYLSNPQVIQSYHNLLVEGIQKNTEGVKSCNATYDAIVASCQKELEKQDLPIEERHRNFDRMISVAKMKSEKNTEDKKHHTTVILAGLAAIGAVSIVVICNQLKN